jgi:hypothetical protein
MTPMAKMMATATIKTNRLRLLVVVGEDDPRVFDLAVPATSLDMQRAVDAGVTAFNAAFNTALKASRRAPASRAAKRRKPGIHLAHP